MIRVLVVDDQALVRQALAALLQLEADIDVVGQAGDAAEAVAAARECDPDVVLMDVQIPSAPGLEDGIAAGRRIIEENPRRSVIVLTTFGRPGYLRRAMESGAVGFMVKDAPAATLVEAIRRVRQGLRVVDPELAAASLSMGPSPLTEREVEVLRASAGGRPTSVIASELFLSEGTVRNHLSAAMTKIGARSRAEALQIATDNGWLD